MAQPDPRQHHKRRRTIFKRDYQRGIEEINRITKLVCNVDNVEQLDSVRTSLLKTKQDLEKTYLGILDTIDETKDEDKRLEDEILKERDGYFLNIDRGVGLCVAFRKKFEGQGKRESLNASVVMAGQASSAARLPKINVPKFNGDLRKFLDFKALFENLVHNDEEISPVRKMHYLKESLVEEAAKTLANIPVSDEGYKEAWGRVLTKYDNKRVIIHTHFNDLFGAEKIRTDAALRHLLDRIDVAIRGLRACGEATDPWSSVLSYLLYTKLDTKTKTDFDNTVTTNAAYFPFKDLFKFCETRACNVEARKVEEPTTSNQATNWSKPPEPRKAFLTSRITCVACQSQHLLIDCPVFASKSATERLQLIQSSNLCVNCFSRNHNVSSCQSPKSCKICQQRHHYLLHVDTRTTSNVAKRDVNTQTTQKPFIVLPSAVVRFQCGKVVGDARILLDTCSQVTLISDELVRRLRLPTRKNDNCNPIRGVGFESVGTPRSCSLTIASRINTFTLNIQADVIPANAIPYAANSLKWGSKFSQVTRYPLADTAFYSKSPIIRKVDLILGAQYVEQCLLNETTTVEELTLRNTMFGWTLNGGFPADQPEPATACHLTCLSIAEIDDRLSRLFDLEEEPSNKDETDTFCEKHYLAHRTRTPSGQFVVKLPFRLSPALLGTNERKAIAILNHCQTRAEPRLREGYAAFMAEYERLNHMSPVETEDTASYLIPHHAVLRPESTTTKIRVVFNASATSSSGYSLNDLLSIGPQLQPELLDALLRFRTYPVAFTADIAMMYRCIWIHEEDRKYQQIAWRTAPSEPLQTFQLNTVTYGTAPASFLAVRCLHDLSAEIQTKHPSAAEAIKNHFYMDDLMTGANSVEEAVQLQRAIHKTLEGAGFQLRKYQSNNSMFLQHLPADRLQHGADSDLPLSTESVILGVGWNQLKDAFYVRTSRSPLIDQLSITKRQLLSEISKVFDPLGIVSPVTIRAKLFIQRVWREEVKWDQPISPELTQEVQKYLRDILSLAAFSLDRPYANAMPGNQELIGFCDASEKAYCAVVYTRCTLPDDTIAVRLVCVKTRVAPLKPITIPRLELQSATLLTKLATRVRTILAVPVEKVHLFCDSQVVLAWIAKPHANWNVFVNNRTRLIAATFPTEHWRYVPSGANPADLPTRGMSAQELVRATEWTHGPDFLYSPIETREESHHAGDEPLPEPTEPEWSSLAVTEGRPKSFLENCRSYRLMLVVLGRVVLFTRKWRAARPAKDKYPPLSDNYLSRGRIAAILLFQAAEFVNEIQAIRSGQLLPKGNRLRALNPFLDEEGILRVQGRLANSPCSFQKRHPIVMPSNCHYLRLYVTHLHNTFCHANKSFVTSFVLAEYWVCGGLTNVVKSVLNACVRCARYRAETYTQVMGQLPLERTIPSRPFTNTGVDFCGPFQSKCVGHRSLKINKIYACIYVCMSTRTVHIEVVSDLTTTNFLMSLHRFIARRGIPTTIFSDCGTNFVGADNYLNLAHREIQQDATAHPIKWVFNPPRSPHRGGLWEAAVKAAKSHVQRVVHDHVLQFEEYNTLFTRIESIMNSRPLCYRSSPQKGELILTPSHFLMGSTPYELPELAKCTLPLWKRYDLSRILVQSFWRAWKSDYLNALQRSQKWNQAEPNIQVGQVVLLKDDSAPGVWPYGIVTETHPDVLGAVRTVLVRSSAGKIYKRDIRSLIKLPLQPVEDDSIPRGNVVTNGTVSAPAGAH